MTVKRLLLWSVLGALTFPVLVEAATPNNAPTVVQVALPSLPSLLHPLVPVTMEERWLHGLVHTPLFFRDSNWQIRCGVCTKIPTPDDGFELKSSGRSKRPVSLRSTWEIRPEATWGDGTPIAAKDFRLAWEMAMSATLVTPAIAAWKEITGVEVDQRNPRKFTLVHHEARADFLQQGLLWPVPFHIEEPIWRASANDWASYSTKTRYRTNSDDPAIYSGQLAPAPLPTTPLRNAPLRFVPTKATSKVLASKLKAVEVRTFGNTDQLLNELVAANVDLVPEGILPAQTVKTIEAAMSTSSMIGKRYKIHASASTGLELVAFNLRNPLLLDRNIRIALAEVIDRPAIAAQQVGSNCCLALHVVHPKDVAMNPTQAAHVLGNADPKAAEARMQLAGWTRGADGIWEKDGHKISIKLEFVRGDAHREALANTLANAWKKAGFAVSPESIAQEVWSTETLKKARYTGLALFGVRLRPGEFPQALLHSREIPTLQNGYAGQNSMGWSNPTFDSGLIELTRLTNPDDRSRLLADLYKVFVNDLPLIPLYFQRVIAISSPLLPNFAFGGHDQPSSLEVANWLGVD